MPAKIIPVVDGKETTWARIQAIMGGVTRQQAQSKYRKVSELGAVTTMSLQQRYQAPEVATRKIETMNNLTASRILAHARMHGPTHTAIRYSLSRDEVVAMLKK